VTRRVRIRLRWFGHLEFKNADVWISVCIRMEVMGIKLKIETRKTGRVCE
jgi:hypothetical protein